MKKENNKWYIGWIIFPAWYLIGKKYIILPVIQSVFEAMSYSDAYLITNYLWNLIAIVILFSLYGTDILRDIKQIRQYDIKSIASGYIKSFAVIVLFTILGGIMQFVLSSGNNEQSINEITLRMTMKEHYWAIMILSAFIGPILEELIFRWFIFSSINKSLIIKVIVSSVLFGLMHFIPSIGAISLNELCLQAIQYVLAGIAFCLVYIKRGNVVFGIAAHMSINLMHNLMYLVNRWG